MHRVVTKYCDRFGKWIVDPGPWLVSRDDADNWASILRHLGYQTEVESQGGAALRQEGDREFAHALSSMA